MNEELRKALENFKGEVKQWLASLKSEVETAVKDQSDASNSKVETLQGKIGEMENAVKAYDEQLSSLGTMGIHTDGGEGKAIKEQWEKAGGWTAFFRSVYQAAAGGIAPSLPYKVNNPWKGAEGIKELCLEAGRRRKVELDQNGAIVKTASNADDGSEGGFFIPDEITSEYIDIVRAQTPIMQMPGVTILSGLRGDLPVPKVSSGLTGYHVGEIEAPTRSDAGFELKWLRPKKVGAFTKQSNRLLYQSRGVVDTILRDMLSRDCSLEMNRGLLNGLGSESEAKGLLRYSASMTTTVGGSNVSPTSARRFTIDDAANMETALDAANELRDTPTYGFLMHPITLGGMKRERVMQYSGQARRNAAPVDPSLLLMSQKQIEERIGYAIKTTTQFPATTSGDSQYTDVLFGDWRLFWIGTWRDPIFKVSDVASDASGNSAFLNDQLFMVMFMEYDCQLMREAAFTIFDAAENSPDQWSA